MINNFTINILLTNNVTLSMLFLINDAFFTFIFLYQPSNKYNLMQLIASNNSIKEIKRSYCIAQDYRHSVRMIELNDGNRPIGNIRAAIIGMVCTTRETDEKPFH